MSCERMESRILAYMDGRLNESERAEVQKHLDACAVCRVRATEFSSVNDLLDELPMIEPSPAFDVRVRARIAAEPVKQSWWAQVWATLSPSPRIAENCARQSSSSSSDTAMRRLPVRRMAAGVSRSMRSISMSVCS